MKKTGIVALLFAIILLTNFISCKHAVILLPTTSDLLFPQVKNIVNINCIVCHSPGGQGMPLFLNSDSAIVQNSAQIKAATCDPVSPRNRRMPPTGQLPDTDTAVISQWYAGGGTMNNTGLNK
jgi:uncharacterized membrane protein